MLRTHAFRMKNTDPPNIIVMHTLTFAYTPEARQILRANNSCTGLLHDSNVCGCCQWEDDLVEETGIILPS